MLISLLLPLIATAAVDLDSGLAGRWELSGDCRDSSGNANHGINHGTDLSAQGPEGKANGAAHFDGKQSYIEVPNHGSLNLGAGDFTLSVWVNTEKELDDILGDIASQYDPGTRRGFQFGFLNNAGVSAGQSNYRNLFFGIDSGRIDPAWTDCGRPGNNLMVFALTVFNGDLYAGTFESASHERGHVYRYAGGTDWTDCGSPDKANSIMALAVFNGDLYAAASHYRSKGSSLAESENLEMGGRIYRYKSGTDWELCGELENPEAIIGLAVFKGKLYASSLYSPGLYRYEGGTTWVNCGNPGGRIEPLSVFNGNLYAGGYDLHTGGISRYDGGKNWTYLGTPPGVNQTYSFAYHFGEMYVGTWPEAKVFRHGGGTEWIDVGRLGEEKEVMGMMVYNGKMYAGTLPLAEVYRFDGEGKWISTVVDLTPDVIYRRAWTMALYQGRLYCGTLPSGHVFSLEAGQSVTYDHEAAPGWRHLAAMREGGKLKLFIDGKQVAASTTFDPAEYDLTNREPLRIGFGAQDYLNGSLRDFRIYQRALANAEIEALFLAP